MNSEDDMSEAFTNQKRNERHVHYADSWSGSDGSECSEFDKYLDEAMDSEPNADDDDDYMAENYDNHGKQSVNI